MEGAFRVRIRRNSSGVKTGKNNHNIIYVFLFSDVTGATLLDPVAISHAPVMSSMGETH